MPFINHYLILLSTYIVNIMYVNKRDIMPAATTHHAQTKYTQSGTKQSNLSNPAK